MDELVQLKAFQEECSTTKLGNRVPMFVLEHDSQRREGVGNPSH